MIKPTVGRVLWLWNAYGTNIDRVQPFDASIVFVHSDTEINVAYHDHEGVARMARVDLLQDDTSGLPDPKDTKKAYATWMPYQVGQAKAQPPTT